MSILFIVIAVIISWFLLKSDLIFQVAVLNIPCFFVFLFRGHTCFCEHLKFFTQVASLARNPFPSSGPGTGFIAADLLNPPSKYAVSIMIIVQKQKLFSCFISNIN